MSSPLRDLPVRPRIYMKSRIKVFNPTRSQSRTGTVVLRQNLYLYRVHFDDGTREDVDLEDLSSWEFVHNNPQAQISEHGPVNNPPNIQRALAANIRTLDPSSSRAEQPEYRLDSHSESLRHTDVGQSSNADMSQLGLQLETPQEQHRQQQVEGHMEYTVTPPGENLPEHNTIHSPKRSVPIRPPGLTCSQLAPISFTSFKTNPPKQKILSVPRPYHKYGLAPQDSAGAHDPERSTNEDIPSTVPLDGGRLKNTTIENYNSSSGTGDTDTGNPPRGINTPQGATERNYLREGESNKIIQNPALCLAKNNNTGTPQAFVLPASPGKPKTRYINSVSSFAPVSGSTNPPEKSVEESVRSLSSALASHEWLRDIKSTEESGTHTDLEKLNKCTNRLNKKGHLDTLRIQKEDAKVAHASTRAVAMEIDTNEDISLPSNETDPEERDRTVRMEAYSYGEKNLAANTGDPRAHTRDTMLTVPSKGEQSTDIVPQKEPSPRVIADKNIMTSPATNSLLKLGRLRTLRQRDAYGRVTKPSSKEEQKSNLQIIKDLLHDRMTDLAKKTTEETVFQVSDRRDVVSLWRILNLDTLSKRYSSEHMDIMNKSIIQKMPKVEELATFYSEPNCGGFISCLAFFMEHELIEIAEHLRTIRMERVDNAIELKRLEGNEAQGPPSIRGFPSVAINTADFWQSVKLS